LNVWQVGLSFNCNSSSFCGGEAGGQWGWIQIDQNPSTGAMDADAELAFCGHTPGGSGFAGAGHTKIDVTSGFIAKGHIGDPSGPAALTFWATSGTETDTFRGQTHSGPLTDDFGNPVSKTNPIDSNIPVTPGHYRTKDFLGIDAPAGVAFQLQVAYKPAH
jgi:hypothetical protein